MPRTFLEIMENMWCSCQEVLAFRGTGASPATDHLEPTYGAVHSFLSSPSIFNCCDLQDVSAVYECLIFKKSGKKNKSKIIPDP